ncbi:MAG: aldo/keto reductase [Candidatus Kariarchaeaceae archaeon]|jgi:aryl-alcohol dehydrogenase-like predicted oxidoreductase
MKSTNKKISRRNFVKKASLSIGGIAGFGFTKSCADHPLLSEKKQYNDPIDDFDDNDRTPPEDGSFRKDLLPRRILGSTGLEISMLAFGGGSQFVMNEDGDWEPLLERAIELGINFFDTSVDYNYQNGRSEERYGEILSPIRDQVYIATKFNGFKDNKRDVDVMMQEFETSLTRLKTDYVDVLSIHFIDNSDSVSDIENGVFKKLQELKNDGSVKFIGFSSMDSAERSKELIEQLEFDVVLLAMNPTTYGNFAQVALPAAIEKNMGVLAMKVMRNIVGQSATAEELISYALSLDGTASACIGHYGQNVLEENAELVKNFGPSSIRDGYGLLEKRLHHLAGPHALCWAHPNYHDGCLV